MPVSSVEELWMLVNQLRHNTAFPHDVEYFKTIETHISIVVLTGQYAYKFKKPVNYGFLDFSTFSKREYYCKQEVSFNKRLAPDVYIDVRYVGGAPPKIGGKPIIEPVVFMHEFPQEEIFINKIQSGNLTLNDFARIGRHAGKFHIHAERAPLESRFGSPQIVKHYVVQNFEQIKAQWDREEPLPEHLFFLESWSLDKHSVLEEFIAGRKNEGFVKHCHGDMHLKNIVDFNGRIQIFDCIEFNEELSWIDEINEIAFLMMDTAYHNADYLGWNFLNWWLAWTGDYEGLKLLQYYMTYRAMVRAKVSLFQGDVESMKNYISLAYGFAAKRPKPVLILMVGVSGSGKSTIAEYISAHGNYIWIRSDVERKRLAGLLPDQPSDGSIYSPEFSHKTYQRLYSLAKHNLLNGFSVVVDATFLRRDHRAPFIEMAKQLDIPLFIIYAYADESVYESRIEARRTKEGEPSEATIEVMRKQLATLEEPSADEGIILAINTTNKEPEKISTQILEEMTNVPKPV